MPSILRYVKYGLQTAYFINFSNLINCVFISTWILRFQPKSKDGSKSRCIFTALKTNENLDAIMIANAYFTYIIQGAKHKYTYTRERL